MRTLEDSQGELSSESKVKAEMLNDFFSTVFTIEKTKRTLLYWTHCVMLNLWTLTLVWTLLHCSPSLAAQCIVVGPDCGCVCLFVAGGREVW